MRNLDAINPKGMRPSRFTSICACLPMMLGLISLPLAYGAAPNVPLGENPVSQLLFAMLAVAAIIALISVIFRWGWQVRHYGVSLFFGISIDALRIAGGIIIVSSGFSLLSGKFTKKRGLNKKVENEAQKRNDIALTPLAIPMLAGPGSISLLIAFYQEHNSTLEIIISCFAILAIAVVIFIILRSAHYLAKFLGASGIVAISRIIGFIVIAIGIQYIVSAIINIIKSNLV